MPPHLVDELMHFLRVYKELEGKKTEISKFYDSNYAKQAIETAGLTWHPETLPIV